MHQVYEKIIIDWMVDQNKSNMYPLRKAQKSARQYAITPSVDGEARGLQGVGQLLRDSLYHNVQWRSVGEPFHRIFNLVVDEVIDWEHIANWLLNVKLDPSDEKESR